MTLIWDKIVSILLHNDHFINRVRELSVDVYKKESLHIQRIWGNESRITIGNNVVLNDAVINTISGDVSIGDESFMGHGVYLLTGSHDYFRRGLDRQHSVPEEGRDIVIGKGVWIASRTIVLGPCTIGDHSIISAGSVVTGTIECNSLYAGTPATLVKTIKTVAE